MSDLRIVGLEGLEEGKTFKFAFSRQGRRVEGFLARHQGRVVAFENVCRHIPVRLDYADNRIFTRDGRHFICQSHGALYEPATGLCVRGPCGGESLKPLAIAVKNEAVWLAEEAENLL